MGGETRTLVVSCQVKFKEHLEQVNHLDICLSPIFTLSRFAIRVQTRHHQFRSYEYLKVSFVDVSKLCSILAPTG